MLQISMPSNEFGRRLDYQRWTEGEAVPWIDTVFALLDECDQPGLEKYKVNWPERTVGEWALTHADIDKRDYERLYHVCNGPYIDLSRDCGYGPTTLLKKSGKIWMSDTRAEIIEHVPLINKLWWIETLKPRVLINGLGLGLAVKAALTHGASHVDVVEIDKAVIDIVGPNFDGEPVTIHHADAFEIGWPRGTEWSVAWHDIWEKISEDNIPEMDRLHAKYKRRVGWQGSWQRKGCLDIRKNSRRLEKALREGDWATVRKLDPEF